MPLPVSLFLWNKLKLERVRPVDLTSLSYNWLILHIDMEQILIQIQMRLVGISLNNSIFSKKYFFLKIIKYLANPPDSQTLNQKRKLLLRFSRLVGWKFVWPWSGVDKRCLAEGHMEAAMCVKWWLQKCDLIILKSISCLGFLNTEEFYQGWYFGFFWWNFWNKNSLYCTYQSLCMTFTIFFGFLLNLSTSLKSCVK